MFNPVAIDILSDSAGRHVIPAAHRLIGLMGVRVPDAQIVEAVRTPPFMIRDPLSYAVREVARRLCLIMHASERREFRLDSIILKADVISINFMRENSFLYEEILTRECAYIVPAAITEFNEFYSVMLPIVRWKEMPQLSHWSPIGVALLLNITGRLVMAEPKLRGELDSLIETMIGTPSWMVAERVYRKINEVSSEVKEVGYEN